MLHAPCSKLPADARKYQIAPSTNTTGSGQALILGPGGPL